MDEKKHRLINRFAVFAVFGLAVIAGIGYGVLNLRVLPVAEAPASEVVTAPSEAEYRTAAGSVLTPFFVQAQKLDETAFTAIDPIFVDLIDKTQERLLRLRVPGADQNIHLSCVLLLEQWRRAMSGSKADQKLVLANTRDLLGENSWLIQ
ncbi:MAG: hypothetical protein WCT10_01940 [Patescibacteria group bacterium]